VTIHDKKDLNRLVLQTVNRLRLIQVDFADESGQTRIDYLREEIERALKTVLPEDRNVFLQRLIERFPAGSPAVQSVLKKQEVKSSSAVDESKLNDTDFLVQRLSEIIPTLSDSQRESIHKSLQTAGLRPKAKQDYSVELGQNLKEKLQISDESALDANQIEELSGMLVDFVLALEPLIWNTWRKLSSRSTIRPQGALKKTLGQFLCNEAEVSGNKVDNELKDLQRLIAAITTAVSRVGSQFAKHHLAKFSPSEISALVRMEHGSVFVSQEVKCWRKYAELAETLDEDSIEMEIRKAIVDYVESLVKGRGQ
jgi:hypothetical protein